MSSSPTVTRKGVASSGSMAPCRSHHGYYTRQNWIFEGIHQELSPLTRKLDGKQINLRIRIIEVLRNVHRDQNRHQIVWKPNIEGIAEVNFRLRRPCKIDISISNCDNRGGSWVSHVPSRGNKTDAGTSSWPSWISHFTGSFVGHSLSEMLCAPALLKGEKKEKEKRRSFTSI